MSLIPTIYKNPQFTDFIIDKYYNLPLYNQIWIRTSIPYLNMSDFSKLPNAINSYIFSKHPSNKAIEIMLNNLDKIELFGLLGNMNQGVVPLIEMLLPKLKKNQLIPGLSNSNNSAIILFLENNLDLVSWDVLSENINPIAIRILENNLDKVNWKILSKNESAVRILENNLDKVCWKNLSKNENAIHILKNNLDKVDWYLLSNNKKAISILEKNLDKVNWQQLSLNENAIHILKNNLQKVNIEILLHNQNQNTLELIELLISPDKLITSQYDLFQFLLNPISIDYLEKHMDKLTINIMKYILNNKNIRYILQNENPKTVGFIIKIMNICSLSLEEIMHNNFSFILQSENAFLLDFQAMSKIRCKIIYDELCQKVFHPTKIDKWIDYHIENGGRFEDFDMI